MKLFQTLILILFFSINTSTQSTSQELTLNIYDCYNVTAILDQGTNAYVKSFSLEKMLSEGIWSQEDKITTKDKAWIFTNLKEGTYRIRIINKRQISTAKHKDLISKINTRFSKEIISDPFVIKTCEGFGSLNNTSSTYQRIKIFPNPAKQTLSVQITDTEARKHNLLIRDILGQILIEEKITSGLSTIDVSNFPSGMYLLVLLNGEKQTSAYSQKIIISK